jgi:hypothetical protein
MTGSRGTAVPDFTISAPASVGSPDDRPDVLQLGLADVVPVHPVHGYGIMTRYFRDYELEAFFGPRLPSDLEVEVDETGQVIAGDRYGAAIGVGHTPAEAVVAWQEAAHDHYGDLAANEGRLHPRMYEQLLFLRKFFG